MSAIAAPFRSFGAWYLCKAQKYPFYTAFFTSGIKTSAADIFAQKLVERNEEFDWTRHAMMTSFGFLYLGSFQYLLYNRLFVQWCGGITAHVGHVGVAPLKTLMDQGIHHPFIYFPTFFAMKSIVEQQKDPLVYAFHKWQRDIWGSCKALWTIWVPAQLLNFAFVPRYLRVPFAAGVSFLWCIVLSVLQGAPDKPQEELTEAQQTLSSPYEPRGTALKGLQLSSILRQAAVQQPLPVRHPRLASLLPRHSAAAPLL